MGCRRTLILSGGAGKDAMIKVIKIIIFWMPSISTNRWQDALTRISSKALLPVCADAATVRKQQACLYVTIWSFPNSCRCIRPCFEKRGENAAILLPADSRYCNCLLTGNTSTGAHLKLQHFGLDQYFNHEHSVFGEISENREMLAKVAFHRLYMQNEEAKPNELIFIGDTPNDVRCANAIGAPCLIILEGSGYKPEDFSEVKPWKIIDRLPDDPKQLELLLDETESYAGGQNA